MTKVQEPLRYPPNYPVDRTSSTAAPILDTLGVGYFVLNGAGWLALENADPDMRTTGVLLSAGLSGLYLASAISGYRNASRCDDVKVLNAQCITGNLEACRALSPGWSPPRAIYPQAAYLRPEPRLAPAAAPPEPEEPPPARVPSPEDSGPRRLSVTPRVPIPQPAAPGEAGLAPQPPG